MPRVSIVMNCYNGEKYLRQAIDSVFAQSFGDWEIIFWDNASTDATAQIARSYDERLRYFRSAQQTTLGRARREAVKQARGEWVGFLDCDDWWLPNKLQVQMDALEGSRYVLCYSGIEEFDASGALVRRVEPAPGSGDLFERLLLQFDINMVTPLLRLDVLRRHDLNFEPEVTASEEYNLFMRVAAKGEVLAMPQVLGAYRVHSGSLTDRQIARWHVEREFTLDQLRRENPGIEARYPRAFREASARGEYYKARYQMSEGKAAEARATLKSITDVGWKYRVLHAVAYLPALWEVLHRPSLKRVAATRIETLQRWLPGTRTGR